MFKKIKEYFELNALYRKSKKILIINAASAIASVKDIAEMAEKFVKAQSEADTSSSKKVTEEITKYMSHTTDGNEKYSQDEKNRTIKIN